MWQQLPSNFQNSVISQKILIGFLGQGEGKIQFLTVYLFFVVVKDYMTSRDEPRI